MFTKRTDLALEARELWTESAGKTAKLPGVRADSRRTEGYPVTEVEVLDSDGETALSRPAGRYITLDFTDFYQRSAGFFDRAVRALGMELAPLLPETGPVLVVGLGNPAMTPDALGPLALDSVLVTRHLSDTPPFDLFRPVAAFRTGVAGTTGVETAETVQGLVKQIQPAAVIAVDAFAARRRARLCCTVQLSDTGILPGSGVGNHRAALNRETLGVPVAAVGVPTVVDAATLAADLMEEAGQSVDPDALRTGHEGLFVTPRDIDAQVRDLAKVAGFGINWALQSLDIAEMNALLS